MNKATDTSKKEDKKYTASVEQKEGDLTKRISVREIENGYLVSVEKYGDTGKGWKSDTKEYYSKTNPLDTETKADNFFDRTEQSIKEMQDTFSK